MEKNRTGGGGGDPPIDLPSYIHLFPTFSYLSHLLHLRRLYFIVSIVEDLGIYFSHFLPFEFHINILIGRALKVLGFIKRNTTDFSSTSRLRVPYLSLVRSKLEFGIPTYPMMYLRRTWRVQNRFPSNVVFLLKINHQDYSPVRPALLSHSPYRCRQLVHKNPFSMVP